MTMITNVSATSVTVSVPLAIRHRNGRPRIVLPDIAEVMPSDGNQARVTLLRAIARAWHWRRQIESGEATTLSDIAAAEKITRPFVSRLVKLAYLSPKLLERLISGAPDLEIPVEALAARAVDPWARQRQSGCVKVSPIACS
jgi:hypothetical protein